MMGENVTPQIAPASRPRLRRPAWLPHSQDLPLTALVVMVGGWALLWLLQVTDNPFSQLLSMDPESFLLEARPLDYVVYVGGYGLLLALELALLVVGLGRRGAWNLMRPPRSRTALAPEGAWWRRLLSPGALSASFCVALALGLVVGTVLSSQLPDRFQLEVPYQLEDFEFESARVAVAVALVRVVRVAQWQLFLCVPLLLVLQSGVVDVRQPRQVLAIAGALFVGGGIVMASPATGTLPYCVALWGPASVVCGCYFLAARSWPAASLLAAAVLETLSLAAYLL